MGPRRNFSKDSPERRAHDAAAEPGHSTVAPAGEGNGVKGQRRDAETAVNGGRPNR